MNVDELIPASLVRHVKAADWGVGVVVAIVGEKARIHFEHRGEVVVKAAVAAPMLVAVPPSEIAPESPLLDPERWEEYELPPERRSKKGAAPCRHCGLALNRGPHSIDRKLKACPRCSTEDGVEHVFYESPAAFGTTEHRESGRTPEGTQSHCTACRTGADQAFSARACSTVAR